MSTAWRTQLNSITHGACRGCALCDGHACAGEVPGMGGKGEADLYAQRPLLMKSGSGRDRASRDRGCSDHVDENIGDAMPERDFHDAPEPALSAFFLHRDGFRL